MSELLSLSRPFANVATAEVASWHPERAGHDRRQLAAMTLAVRDAVLNDKRQRWVVADENAACFLAGFLGVLATGRRVVLPQHIGRDAVLSFVDETTGVISASPELVESAALNPVSLAAEATVDPAAAAALTIDLDTPLDMFTSGSTGDPKRISKRFRQLDAELAVLEALWGEQLGNCRVVATVPHYHLYGLIFRLLWPFAAGRAFPELSLLEPPRIAAACAVADATALVSSPAHLKRWPGFASLQVAKVKLPVIFSSAGPLPAETSRRLHDALDPISVWEVYGSTESGGIAWRDQGAPGFADWHVFDGVELGFPDGQQGRLSVRSAPCGGDWMDTGDRAELVGKAFRLLGREDGVVKIEDRRISLQEIEQALEALDWVSEAAVLAMDGERQTTAAALVLSAEGRRELEQLGGWRFRGALRERLGDRFTDVVLPRRFRYLEALPRNATGKVLQRDLQALFERPA
ncbi:AMP-binding protein [Natronospira bacteriovora]|uniref:Class I adenylate-forming enzyme family protein n=1 Tax=Natronospira bacteriovora TaxID=3069753 RepID=A0ABU0W7S3_9GAMM|nr:class I adenylate-forming enzyme family protein [Natronospira sp. AB-CW4]MDQ2069992.1 class I adenylate-forming enzyme family protein [Natronospira sp. AB-CW4]